jgi:hypothetical protein
VTFQPYGAGKILLRSAAEGHQKNSKTVGFNNPANRAFTNAVDPLEPVDAFNISVPLPWARD